MNIGFSTEDPEVITNATEPIFSGLYSYHVPTQKWCKLASDISRPNPPNVLSIKSRVGHSMLFHPVSYCIVFILYISFSKKPNY